MINFIKLKYIYFLISFVFLVPSVFFLLRYGLKLGIDFTGGSLTEIRFTDSQTVQVEESFVDEVTSGLVDDVLVQVTSETYIIRTKTISEEEKEELMKELEEKIGPVEVIRFESVGPTLGKELLKKTLWGVLLATTAILLYVAYQFKEVKYGVCAVLAMLHDSLIVVGTFSMLGYFWGVEVDTLFVTALLTILSFSVHDTIVVYDRIRETLKKHSTASFESVVNKAIAETLARSVNNSMTIIFMLSALYLLGGATTKWFVLALLIGTITGTYSSTFTATPLLVMWNRIEERVKNARELLY